MLSFYFLKDLFKHYLQKLLPTTVCKTPKEVISMFDKRGIEYSYFKKELTADVGPLRWAGSRYSGIVCFSLMDLYLVSSQTEDDEKL